MDTIEIDGSEGEGGGQILRTSVALSAITGQPLRVSNIRKRRKKPGLQKQHLTAVLACAEVCRAKVEGAEIGSSVLTFEPKSIVPGTYRFSIGTAGSASLVLQTVLPVLLSGDAPSEVTIEGGTHNPLAPPFEFLQGAFLPLLTRMGAVAELSLERAGFYPTGGGKLRANIHPWEHRSSLSLPERGALVSRGAEAIVARLRPDIPERELAVVRTRLGFASDELSTKKLPPDMGPGNVLLIRLVFEHVTEIVAAFGEREKGAEDVASEACEEAARYLSSRAAVGPHLADQLLLPLALGKGGSFTASEITEHTSTNLAVIGRFLPIRSTIEPDGDDRSLITVTT